MNTEFLSLCRRGVDLIAEFQGCSEDSLLEAGASPLLAAQLARLQHVYFGRTSNTRKQRLARDAARTRAHDLATLDSIESYTRRVRDTNRAWDLRLELCRTESRFIPSVAKKLLKQLNPPRRPKMDHKIISDPLPPLGKVAHGTIGTTRGNTSFGAKIIFNRWVLPINPARILCTGFPVKSRHADRPAETGPCTDRHCLVISKVQRREKHPTGVRKPRHCIYIFYFFSLLFSPATDIVLKGFVLTISVIEKERSLLAEANSNDLSAYVDEIVSRAPRFSAKQIDAVAGALDIKGAK